MPMMTVISVCLLLCVVWLNFIASTEADADAGVTVDVSGCSSETGSCDIDERFHYPRDEWPHGFTDWFSFPYANVPGSEITGLLHYPTPHNACSLVDPPPGLVFSGSGSLSSASASAGSAELNFRNDMGSAGLGFGENISMWFAIVDDFSACAVTDKINNLRVAGYSLMISYPLEDLYSRDDISNTDFPVVLVSQSFANYVINATLTAKMSQISASVSANETAQVFVAIALVAALFVAALIPVAIGVCICCYRYRIYQKCRCRRNNHDHDSLFEPERRVGPEEIEIPELPIPDPQRAESPHPPQYGELQQEGHVQRRIQQCPICNNVVDSEGEAVHVLPWDPHHKLHSDCVNAWLAREGECPICRQHVPASAADLEHDRIYMNVRADIRRFNSFSDAVHSCSICLEDFQIGETIRALPCDPDHVFHPHCIEQWLGQSGERICPVCRAPVEL